MQRIYILHPEAIPFDPSVLQVTRAEILQYKDGHVEKRYEKQIDGTLIEKEVGEDSTH